MLQELLKDIHFGMKQASILKIYIFKQCIRYSTIKECIDNKGKNVMCVNISQVIIYVLIKITSFFFFLYTTFYTNKILFFTLMNSIL